MPRERDCVMNWMVEDIAIIYRRDDQFYIQATKRRCCNKMMKVPRRFGGRPYPMGSASQESHHQRLHSPSKSA